MPLIKYRRYRPNHAAVMVPAPGGAAAPTVTYVGSYASAGAGTDTITATISIGNPSYISTRRVICVVSGGSANSFPQINASSTINGVAVDQVTSLSASSGGGPTGSNCVEFVSASVPSGTTSVAFSLKYSATVFTSPRIIVYIVDESLLSSAVPATGRDANNGTTGLNTATVDTTTKAGGFILAGVWAGGGAGPSITSSTETYTTDYSSSANMGASVNGISSNASNSVSTQAPPAGGNSILALAAYL